MPQYFVRRSRFRGAALLLLLAAACHTPAEVHPEYGPMHARTVDPDASAAQLLSAVRHATARFHSQTQAAQAGYGETDHCVPQMGYHRVNESLVDPVFDPLQPEVMLYATGPGGQPRLVAVEYIVIDVGQPRPSFGGHPFDIGGTPVPVPHWSLHVWLYEANPDGLFAPFNPRIACP